METNKKIISEIPSKALTIIVPVYNEELGLNKTIAEMERLISEHDFISEVIFVNDGSTDNSTETLRNIDNSAIKVIEHSNNHGYGAAIKTGVAEAVTPYICITDADCTYPNDQIDNLFQKLDGYSMVIGARIGENVNIPVLRKLPKWILNKLANYLTGIKIPDINSGLRIMNKQDVLSFIKILPDGFSFTTTITLCMLTNKMKVLFVPINYHFRQGNSKIRPIYDTLNFFQIIIRTCLYFNPLKIFIPFSLILFFLAFAILFFSHLFFGRIMDVTFGTVVMTAVLVLAIGMLADLIDKRL